MNIYIFNSTQMNNINVSYFFNQVANQNQNPQINGQQNPQQRASHLIIVRRQNPLSASNPQIENNQNIQNSIENNENNNENNNEQQHQNQDQKEKEKDFSLEIENLAVQTENLDFVKCPICIHIYVNPIACGNCLNHFCMFCIREWLIRNPNQCPLCHNFREMRCFPMLKNMLDKLQFNCINKEQGCSQIIYYEQAKKHEEVCEYKLEVCPQKECRQQMIRRLLQKHIKEECDFAEEACKWCLKEHKKKVIELHEENCDFKETECNLCGLTFKLLDIDNHKDVCPENLRKCKWCRQLLKQKEIMDHEDCCGERIIKCQGCGYECCLNEHFLHMKQCKEYPVFCNKCETEMKRREFVNHTPEVCMDLRSEWFAVGIIDESNVYSARRYHDIGHKSYLISANGIFYSSHNPYENWQNKPFIIEQDDIISVCYENNQKLKFVNHNKNQELNVNLDPETIDNGNFYPCACLRCPGDCIEIVEINQDLQQQQQLNQQEIINAQEGQQINDESEEFNI
ncbi:hypothetical protein IMG5_191010 [Ichthyophthirius multifiliis]|uniref:Uncharacterized protein n=1 Tax=Ichthyophthirius multifiliis TaxID=5932 RepID=G0R4B6_ICHMU|nr:hypothetical protein IMG5_191010 [Ichthyophthirius multifiliis]EGR27683.1 hypothetical protein IMG5_191010 [Ichthyophthirius multifiliis]|eukprot:XP_004025135.1 hypothetical protein IMG5_191010 [Ichthyophthirius multifiliis]